MRVAAKIGIGGVLSEIALLSPGAPYRVKRKVLLEGLKDRFRASSLEALDAVKKAIVFGVIQQKKIGGQYWIWVV